MGRDRGRDRSPVTPAIRFLRQSGVRFIERPYRYVERGGTAAFAEQCGVDEHAVIKTLVMENEAGKPLVVLMHGDLEVSTKELAKALQTGSIRPCSERDAERHSGYMVGGISPFGLRKVLPVYVEATILELEKIYINGGRRGLLVELSPLELTRLLDAVPVKCGVRP